MKPDEGIKASSFKPGDKVFISSDKMRTKDSLLPKPKSENLTLALTSSNVSEPLLAPRLVAAVVAVAADVVVRVAAAVAHEEDAAGSVVGAVEALAAAAVAVVSVVAVAVVASVEGVAVGSEFVSRLVFWFYQSRVAPGFSDFVCYPNSQRTV